MSCEVPNGVPYTGYSPGGGLHAKLGERDFKSKVEQGHERNTAGRQVAEL